MIGNQCYSTDFTTYFTLPRSKQNLLPTSESNEKRGRIVRWGNPRLFKGNESNILMTFYTLHLYFLPFFFFLAPGSAFFPSAWCEFPIKPILSASTALPCAAPPGFFLLLLDGL